MTNVLMLNGNGYQAQKPYKFARVSCLDEFSFVYHLDEYVLQISKQFGK